MIEATDMGGSNQKKYTVVMNGYPEETLVNKNDYVWKWESLDKKKFISMAQQNKWLYVRGSLSLLKYRPSPC